jgi:hypothetical protein
MLAMFVLVWIVSFRSFDVRANVVDDDRDTQAMFTAEDVLEKCRLSGALRLFSYRSYYSYLRSSRFWYLPGSPTEASLAKFELSC